MNSEQEQMILRKQRMTRNIRRSVLIRAALLLTALVFLFTCVIGIDTAPSGDMAPSVRAGDALIYLRLGKPADGDVVLYEAGRRHSVGRIVAGPGTEIDRTKAGLLTIRGELQPVQKRRGLYGETRVRETGHLNYPSTCPEGSYLILGDDREQAEDSRSWGYISEEDIRGKVLVQIRRRQL